MMAHWREMKAAHPDAMIFYRLGDFYELFNEDAEAAAAALDIALTKRSRDTDAPPMCGVPVKSADSYLSRLVQLGHRVAICEQMENPAQARARGAKGALKRAVVRVVTPGTLTEEALLDARAGNHLAAVAAIRGRGAAVAWADVSTGRLQVATTTPGEAPALLARIAPRELLSSLKLIEDPAWFDLWDDLRDRLAPQADSRFDSAAAEARLKDYFCVAALDAFGSFERVEIAALGALLGYVAATQMESAPRLSPPVREDAGAAMRIDPASRRNLELFATLDGRRAGSLLAAVDKTVTAAGARLLAERLAAPSTDVDEIAERSRAADWLFNRGAAREAVRDKLKRAPDMERALARLSARRGGPRDLAALRDGLKDAPTLRNILAGAGDVADPLDGAPQLAAAAQALGEHSAFVDRLARALDTQPPSSVADGGFIASGYDPALDALRALREDSGRHIAALEARYKTETGLNSLKIRHNAVLGFFIETPAARGQALLERTDGVFIHRQTTANALRFATVELGELEGRKAGAADKALALERRHFEDLATDALARAEDIARAAQGLAALDVASAAAALAAERGWVRPRVEVGTAFHVKGGRHPVVEPALQAAGEAFAPNDLALDAGGEADRLWLITGPNMAGKSTFLRQNALIAILAQAGLFVPATDARIGIVDRLFSRVGAADDLARGRSTFMVEMVETAAILNQATPRSFVILDEIGRGTATYDGLSIAWAVLEHLDVENRCRGLFATHYHELTALAAQRPTLSAHRMLVKEWKGEIAFLRQVAPGAAERSYGVHVARLAGLPAAVVARAGQVLARLEHSEGAAAPARLAEDLPLFAAAKAAPPPAEAAGDALREALAGIDPDEMTPRDALEALYRLKAASGED